MRPNCPNWDVSILLLKYPAYSVVIQEFPTLAYGTDVEKLRLIRNEQNIHNILLKAIVYRASRYAKKEILVCNLFPNTVNERC